MRTFLIAVATLLMASFLSLSGNVWAAEPVRVVLQEPVADEVVNEELRVPKPSEPRSAKHTSFNFVVTGFTHAVGTGVRSVPAGGKERPRVHCSSIILYNKDGTKRVVLSVEPRQMVDPAVKSDCNLSRQATCRSYQRDGKIIYIGKIHITASESENALAMLSDPKVVHRTALCTVEENDTPGGTPKQVGVEYRFSRGF